MDLNPLLVKADFKDYADLPESLDMARLRPHILAAQLGRLRPILTELLFNELLRLNDLAQAPTPTPLVAPWDSLRKECVPVVAYGSMARYMPFSQNTAVSHGYVVKLNDKSQPVDGRELARMAAIYDGDALTHEVALGNWLKANGHLFATFYPAATACGAAQPGRSPVVVVQGIGRSDWSSNPIPFGR